MNSLAGKQLIRIAVTGLLVLTFMGCNGSKKSPEAGAAQGNAQGTVTLKFFSASPDRQSGIGLVEQMIIDQYVKENPQVKIEVEALQDEPYKQKFKAYVAGNELPDIFHVWSYTAFFKPVMDGGYAAELNPNDYNNYKYLAKALDGFKDTGGKLYGLSKAADFYVVYYNKKIFADNNIEVPTTYEDLINITKKLRANGVSPCAINGKDEWSIGSLYNDVYYKEEGSSDLINSVSLTESKFVDHPVFLKTANAFKQLMDAGFFQNSFSSADYGAARNLFIQGRTAMYYMGSWEVGLQSDSSVPKEFLDNVSAFRFPAPASSKGKATDLLGAYGGGFSVSSSSPNKEAAIKFLNYMMKPDNWAKLSWQTGGSFPSQDVTDYITGTETPLQLTVVDILKTSTSLSGQNFNEVSAPSFKTDAQSICGTFANGLLTPAKFLEELDKAAAVAAKQL
ncbi:ABC transporter substrate-binding protein [Spirochaetia bacterium]|nr:ABC transporter substrate-binding protein [Spirochaetia bacterium]